MLITLFLAASVMVEIFGDMHAVGLIKTAILVALPVLVAAMAVVVGTGRSLSKARHRLSRARRPAPLIRRKERRAAAAAEIGFLVLVPSAVTLQVLAAARDFGALFILVEAIELIASSVLVTLLVLNVRDGRLLSAASRRRKAAGTSERRTVSGS